MNDIPQNAVRDWVFAATPSCVRWGFVVSNRTATPRRRLGLMAFLLNRVRLQAAHALQKRTSDGAHDYPAMVDTASSAIWAWLLACRVASSTVQQA